MYAAIWFGVFLFWFKTTYTQNDMANDYTDERMNKLKIHRIKKTTNDNQRRIDKMGKNRYLCIHCIHVFTEDKLKSLIETDWLKNRTTDKLNWRSMHTNYTDLLLCSLFQIHFFLFLRFHFTYTNCILHKTPKEHRKRTKNVFSQRQQNIAIEGETVKSRKTTPNVNVRVCLVSETGFKIGSKTCTKNSDIRVAKVCPPSGNFSSIYQDNRGNAMKHYCQTLTITIMLGKDAHQQHQQNYKNSWKKKQRNKKTNTTNCFLLYIWQKLSRTINEFKRLKKGEPASQSRSD